MKPLALAAALALVLLTGLAVACGRYGSPHRIPPPATAVETVPVTDPGVTR